MARIRSIKPEFWTSAQILECSRDARLLFIGLWNFCDDAGRHVDSAKQLKAEIFPADDLLVENVRGMLDELEARGLIRRYRFESQELLEVTGWHHQRIDKPQKPRYPGSGDEGSTIVLRTLPPDPIRSDTIRSDRKGSTTAASRPAEVENRDIDFDLFKSLYPKRSGNQPWGRARKAISARLRDGGTWQQMHDGVRRYAAWCEGTGKLNTEHVMQAATFCGPEKPFLLAWDLPTTRADARLVSNIEAAAAAKQRLFGGAAS